MRIVLSGGGTAGHINPALALAETLMGRGHQVYFAGTPKGVESILVPAYGIPFKEFDASGFDRSSPLTLLKGTRKIQKSAKEACRWFIEDIRPHAVVSFGGYACLPVGRAAETLKIPLIIHEQNSVMGMANDFLSKKASAVALTYRVAGERVKDQSKVIVTGNPVRSSVLEATREEGRAYLGIPDDALVLLVFGGSLGARHINTAVVALKKELLAIKNLYVIHITGPRELETVKETLALTPEEEKRYQVMGYQDHMGETLAATDVVVSRAGASSLAEISARCIPALLVPFPHATADHQTINAQEYVERGAAVLVPDDEVETSRFSQQLLDLLHDPKKREEMSAAAATFETSDAASHLADVVELVARKDNSVDDDDDEWDDEDDYDDEDEESEEDTDTASQDESHEGDRSDAEQADAEQSTANK